MNLEGSSSFELSILQRYIPKHCEDPSWSIITFVKPYCKHPIKICFSYLKDRSLAQ